MKNPIFKINAKKILVLIFCAALIFSHFFCYFKFSDYSKIVNTLADNIFNCFNRNSESSEKDNNIFFVFSENSYKFLGKSLPALKLPSESDYTFKNGIFSFNLKENFTIKCAGKGIVKDVGFLQNGLKFVEVRHSGNIVTRYENLIIVGVGNDYNLKNIHIIGTCNKNDPFIFKILKNNEIVENYEILDGEIKWKN